MLAKFVSGEILSCGVSGTWVLILLVAFQDLSLHIWSGNSKCKDPVETLGL